MTDQLHAALGRIASGLYILTAGRDDQATGMLASWVMQAGFEPPMVTVAVRRSHYLAERLSEGAPFVLNIVAEEQKHLLRHFGKGFKPGEPAFDGLETQTADCGAPVLTDCLGYLECEPESHIDSGDHRIVLARVTVGVHNDDRSPLVHLRKSGAHY